VTIFESVPSYYIDEVIEEVAFGPDKFELSEELRQEGWVITEIHNEPTVDLQLRTIVTRQRRVRVPGRATYRMI